VDNNEHTPPYIHYFTRLISPFPNFDSFFIKSVRQAK
jgi:hypothetical protein